MASDKSGSDTNFVFIMTDTQNKSMIGSYGDSKVDTPNLDNLAKSGVRFENAYNTCPVCTPARGSIFSGLHPQINGAWANNISPHRHVALMGKIFREKGFRVGYTGKWHLSGTDYYGNGEPQGGFEPDWWYDGKKYAEDIGKEKFQVYQNAQTADDLKEAGFTKDHIWGHRVADRAIDFLESIGDESFVLSVSFEEPHGPCMAPPEYWEETTWEDIPKPENFLAPTKDKPQLQQVHRKQADISDWKNFAKSLTNRFGSNSYIDREIGRVINAVKELHGDNTVIIYTSDHGNMMGSHGLRTKGPMMYEEICNVPFIVKVPERTVSGVSDALVSHLDILPTMLDLSDLELPDYLHGKSLAPILDGRSKRVRENLMVNFHRFAINHDSFGEFYPIRCITDGKHKLAINLFETDEFYNLQDDPLEKNNLIDDPAYEEIRNGLHETLLKRMDRVRDPFRSYRWGDRSWNSVRKEFYYGGETRPPRKRFSFQKEGGVQYQ